MGERCWYWVNGRDDVWYIVGLLMFGISRYAVWPYAPTFWLPELNYRTVCLTVCQPDCLPSYLFTNLFIYKVQSTNSHTFLLIYFVHRYSTKKHPEYEPSVLTSDSSEKQHEEEALNTDDAEIDRQISHQSVLSLPEVMSSDHIFTTKDQVRNHVRNFLFIEIWLCSIGVWITVLLSEQCSSQLLHLTWAV